MEIYISNQSDKPLYAQITAQIKEQIMDGRLRTGDALPSIRLLAKELHISAITTKRAYEDLEQDGFIDTVPGKGCFVAASNSDFLREESLRQVEGYLTKAVEAARQGGISRAEILEMLELCFEGE